MDTCYHLIKSKALTPIFLPVFRDAASAFDIKRKRLVARLQPATVNAQTLARKAGHNDFFKALTSAAKVATEKLGSIVDTGQAESQVSHPDERIVCLEYTKGKRRVYKTGVKASSPFEIRDDDVSHHHRVKDVLSDFLLPQGYPDSVAPQYAQYMGWRGVQYFFGGAMSVFTTKSLLGALGVGQRHAGEAAAAINWVVKDGAGRMGRFLFARWGRQLDGELKQFRLTGDLLMESGAALELSTALMPSAFLPLACTANLAKNLAAVAASSTRAPIYRTFARQNNLADVTAKGESVANLADVFGTAAGILLAKGNLPLIPTFCFLSLGYLLASRKEVDSVVLPYLNRARLSYASRKFFDDGMVPELAETNAGEPLAPWMDPVGGRVILGARVEDACASPEDLAQALETFAGRQYAITYRPDSRKAFVLLKQGASQDCVLTSTLEALALLYVLDERHATEWWQWPAAGSRKANEKVQPTLPRAIAKLQRTRGVLTPKEALHYIASNGKEIHTLFQRQATIKGWKLAMSTLNPSESRLVIL